MYYDPWRESTTVIIRKPGKPDYSVPKAYRPIALLNTTAKLLSALIADRASHQRFSEHKTKYCKGLSEIKSP